MGISKGEQGIAEGGKLVIIKNLGDAKQCEGHQLSWIWGLWRKRVATPAVQPIQAKSLPYPHPALPCAPRGQALLCVRVSLSAPPAPFPSLSPQFKLTQLVSQESKQAWEWVQVPIAVLLE